MDPAALITAIVGGITAIGGLAWRLIDRADKKRERREIKVEELLKNRVASLESQLEKEKSERAKENHAHRRYNSRIKAAAGQWREQLIENHIDPVPAKWPEEFPEEKPHE